ncbi:MAG: pilus assembly protein PilM [Candidatus Saccharibacteria bacterium]|nr:pilus assembly protein PilM [Candidatus Saccharibacteria bacterium]MCY4010872.1 pilus assembly protein PilM [Candidatus Saccharibacteria bacterium]MCY4089001.1 pilus assembly protein PilM [Candidatus Saccharibacteria bacterium]
MLGGFSDFFGLDIGTTAIRVVQLKGKQHPKALFRYGKMPIEHYLSDKNDDASLRRLAQKIRETLRTFQISTGNVVVGLPNNKIYSTVQEFEVNSASNLKKMLKFQANTIVPQGDDSQIAWDVLDKQTKTPTKKKSVFICSVNSQYAQARLEMLESIKLNVLAFEPDGLALNRAIANNTSQASLLVDVGFRHTDIVISVHNQPRLISAIPIGLASIMRAVENTLHGDQIQNQQLIFQVGLRDQKSQPELHSRIIKSLELLIINLNKATDYFINRYTHHNLEKITLWGDIVYVPGFIEYLASAINLPVEIGNSWQNIVYPPRMREELRDLSVNFAVATGLAERQVI